MQAKNKSLKRCFWVNDDPLYIDYHDQEWGVPLHDSQLLFAMLNLEGQQAGLSWITVLKKRQEYYRCFFDFDAKKIIQLSNAAIEKLLKNPGLIRNRLKLYGIVKNAQAYLNFVENGHDFSKFLWGFVENEPMRVTKNKHLEKLAIERSLQMSKALKKLGFTFVGGTICYAFMQAVGMIQQHDIDCYCYNIF